MYRHRSRKREAIESIERALESAKKYHMRHTEDNKHSDRPDPPVQHDTTHNDPVSTTSIPSIQLGLTYRSIRIGSYKVLKSKEMVYFTQDAICMKIPHLTYPDRLVQIKIPLADISKIDIVENCGSSSSIIFISCNSSSCASVRKDLNLNFEASGLYYDISSEDETMKRITILPDKMSDQVKNLLLSFYSNKISEMPSKLANKLLVERTPKVPIFERQRRLQAMKNPNYEEPTCSICFEPRTQTYLLTPCGHATFCENCATHFCDDKKCPICRTVVTGKIKVFGDEN